MRVRTESNYLLRLEHTYCAPLDYRIIVGQEEFASRTDSKFEDGELPMSSSRELVAINKTKISTSEETLIVASNISHEKVRRV